MRALIFALVALVSVTATARAETCGVLDDPRQMESWPEAADLAAYARDLDGSWPTAQRALAHVVIAIRADDDPDTQRLVKRTRRILAEYDGTEERARALPVDELTPKPCGDIDDDGVPVRTCAWSVLSDPAIELPTDGRCEDKRRIGGVVKVLRTIVASVHAVHVEDAALALTQHAEAWDRLITRGFSQYPWEVWIHGMLLSPTAWGPSKHQLIVLHPSAGFGVEQLSKDPRAAAVVAIEAAGWLYYFRDFRQYAGLSFAASMSNFDVQRWSIGPVAHLSGIGLGYGVAVRGEPEHTVFLLLDVTSALDDGLLEKLSRRAVAP